MHQGMGLDVFNDMPMRRAVHAVYECCYSVPLAAEIARGRPYENHDALFRQADRSLFGLAEESIDSILQAYPDVGRRPGSEKSAAEQCAICDERAEVMDQLADGVEDTTWTSSASASSCSSTATAPRMCWPR